MRDCCNIADILRAEYYGKDLLQNDNKIVICAMRKDGSLYELGWVSKQFAMQQNKELVKSVIDKIKFQRRIKNGHVKQLHP